MATALGTHAAGAAWPVGYRLQPLGQAYRQGAALEVPSVHIALRVL